MTDPGSKQPVKVRASHRLQAWLPGLTQFRGYRREWLRPDILAGLTVAAYLVPQVMAYAEVAGLPPVTGLWAIIGPLAVYCVLGSSRRLSIGPESTTALMTATVLMPLAAGDPVTYGRLAAGLALLVGVLCILGRLVRLGFLADLLSRPVLVGYMTGVALIMIISQLGRLTGVTVQGDGFGPELQSFLTQISDLHWPTVLFATATLLMLLLFGRLAPLAPGPLIAVLLGATIVWMFSLQHHGISVIGQVPVGLPTPQLPALSLADLPQLLLPAVSIAIVGYTDNVLTGRAFARRDAPSIDANAEFGALAGANLTSGLLQGFPVSSSGSRTALADAVGARTQAYSLVVLAAVLTVLLVAAPALALFPRPALAALVVYAAIRLIEIGELRRIGRFRRSELILAVLTTAAVLAFGVLYGVLVAITLSILDLLRRVARPHDGILGYAPGLAGMHDVDDYPNAQQIPGLIVYRYDAPLFFANAEDFRHRAQQAVTDATGRTEWFVLNAEANVDIDVTAADSLAKLRARLADQGITFALARVKSELHRDLERAGLVAAIGSDHVFPTLPTAVQAYLTYYRNRYGTLPPGVHPVPTQPNPLTDPPPAT